MLTLSKSPFPSLPITVSSLRCNSVAQPDITHQQERQIPALRDSCFMLGIANWIVWGSTIYQNTKMQSCSLLWSLNPHFKIYQVLCRKWKCFRKTKMKSDYWAPTRHRARWFLIFTHSQRPKMIPTAFHLRCTEDYKPVLHTRDKRLPAQLKNVNA